MFDMLFFVFQALDSIMNELEAIQTEKKNGDIDDIKDSKLTNGKCESDVEDVSSLLEVDINEEKCDAGSQETNETLENPENSKNEDMVEKPEPCKKRARSLSPISPRKRHKHSSDDTPVKKEPLKVEDSDANVIMKGIEHVVLGNEGKDMILGILIAVAQNSLLLDSIHVNCRNL